MVLLLAAAAFAISYLLGFLPLGSRLVHLLSSHRARDVNPHHLGVENLFYFLSAPIPTAAFGLDMLKGFAALALFGGSPWAALGVYIGHLHPLAILNPGDIPRARGNGVLLGVVAGLGAFTPLPYALLFVPVAAAAAVLASSGYVTLATLTGLALLPPMLVIGGAPMWWPPVALALLALALWRHKASLVRILDHTELKLGEAAPVRGVDPKVVYAAFMVHPLSLDDLWQPGSQRWLKPLLHRGIIPEGWLRRLALLMRPQKQGVIEGTTLSDGRELRVVLIGGPLLPDQIRARPAAAKRMAIQGARFAREMGAEAFGLGALWSTVGDKGLEVQRAVPEIHITNGGAYTAATVKAAVPGLLRRFEEEGGSLASSCAAVVGANGVVAFGVARMIAPHVSELLLVGRDVKRLERSAATLRRKYPQVRISATTDIAECASADLIFSATSDPQPVLFDEHVKPGAWLFDLGRPADVDASVRSVPGVHIVPGGVVRPPGETRTRIDMHFGEQLIPACLAETMIMTATRAFDRKSLGPRTHAANIEFYLHEGERLGFEIVTRDEHVAPVTELV
jgi:predicted amino acid dehydrogenase